MILTGFMGCIFSLCGLFSTEARKKVGWAHGVLSRINHRHLMLYIYSQLYLPCRFLPRRVGQTVNNRGHWVTTGGRHSQHLNQEGFKEIPLYSREQVGITSLAVYLSIGIFIPQWRIALLSYLIYCLQVGSAAVGIQMAQGRSPGWCSLETCKNLTQAILCPPTLTWEVFCINQGQV